MPRNSGASGSDVDRLLGSDLAVPPRNAIFPANAGALNRSHRARQISERPFTFSSGKHP